jgi:hypothetical protein
MHAASYATKERSLAFVFCIDATPRRPTGEAIPNPAPKNIAPVANGDPAPLDLPIANLLVPRSFL